MNKTSQLVLAKKLNMLRQNCTKTKEELEKAIKDTITGYKEIIFGADSPVCMTCLDELQRQQIIDEKVYDQRLMDRTVRKLAWEGLQKNMAVYGDAMIDRRGAGSCIRFHLLERQILRVDFMVFAVRWRSFIF